MLCSALLGAVLLSAAPLENPQPSAADRAAYVEAAATAGRDADSQVELALWCEQHGLDAERLKHLAIAVMTDPSHTVARGLMGMVRDGSAWRKPEAVAERVRSDAELAATLAEYNERRAKIADTASDHWTLGLWCAEHGLEAEAKAHFTAVVRYDPDRDVAWKRLGFKKRDGRWVTDEQLAAERVEKRAQEAANKHWKPVLERLKEDLGSKNAETRGEAEAKLAEIDDVRAVPAVWQVLAHGGATSQRVAVQVLGQIDSPDASRALALLSVASGSAEVRRAAGETLTWRDPRAFVDLLIGLIRRPVRYEVRPVGGPGSPGAIFIEGQRFNVQRVYAPQAPNFAFQSGDRMVVDQYGLPAVARDMGSYRTSLSLPIPTAQVLKAYERQISSPLPPDITLALNRSFGGSNDQVASLLSQALVNRGNPVFANPLYLLDLVTGGDRDPRPLWLQYERYAQIHVGLMMQEAYKAAANAEQHLERDKAFLDRYNTLVHEGNVPVLTVLKQHTGQEFKDDPEAWVKWWIDEQGYAYQPPSQSRPTLVEGIPLAYQTPPLPIDVADQLIGMGVRHSCFAAGTPVLTLTGLEPIETLRVGDRVLTQDVETGALSYQPILTVHHNPPNQTLRIDLGSESIVATPIHRFWKAGACWVMARDLKPGDTLRMLGGEAVVREVSNERVQPVFNLGVGPEQSFFVGSAGALVHDNSLVLPPEHPFDAAPETIASAATSD